MTEIKKYDYIDAIRGLAILGVVFIHSYNYFDYRNPDLPDFFVHTVEYEQKGVQLFFIASAFTLCHSMNSRMLKEKNFIRNFFIRRFFRIAPLFYLLLTLTVLFGGNKYSLSYILSNYLFFYALHPVGNSGIVPYSWTIGIEMFFYILFPILFLRIKKIGHAIGATIVASLLFQLITFGIDEYKTIIPVIQHLDQATLEKFLYRSLMGELPVFLLGFVLFYINKKDNMSSRAILTLSVLWIAQIVLGYMMSDFLIFSTGLLFLCLALSDYRFPLLVNKVTVSLGKLSFSIYLLHSYVLLLLKNTSLQYYTNNITLDCFIRFFLVLTLCYIIGRITYKLVEQKGVQFGNNFIALISKDKK